MAIKRMINKNVTESDRFTNLSVHSQALYFHLNLKADDEGFVSSPNQMIKMLDLKKEHLDELVQNEFLIVFASGICLIRHWHIHNSIRKDRITDTIYQQEKQMVHLESSKTYAVKPTEMPPSAECPAHDGQMSAQNREEEIREDKNRTDMPRPAEDVSVWQAQLNEMLRGSSALPKAQAIRALGKYMKQMEFECIEYAIEQSRHWNKQSVGYVCAILDRLLAQGVHTKEQLAAEVKTRHGPNANAGVISHQTGSDYFDKILERAEEI